MLAPDLYGLRERFDRERIMLCEMREHQFSAYLSSLQ